jgi:hypothetical protein
MVRSLSEQVKEKDFNVGYNAADNTFVDMFAAGIVDPAKVTRSAGLQNAASIALGMVLTTECIVVDKPEPKARLPHLRRKDIWRWYGRRLRLLTFWRQQPAGVGVCLCSVGGADIKLKMSHQIGEAPRWQIR